MEYIKQITQFEWSLLAWFITWVLHQKINLPYRIKRLFKIKVTRSIKPLDCYTCFTFWVALAITLNPINAVFAYLISVIVDKK